MKIPLLSPLGFATLAALASLAPSASAQTAAAPAASAKAQPTSYKFQFGADKAAPGYTLVGPTAVYSPEVGYGFENGAQLTAVTQTDADPLHTGVLTSTRPFSFSMALPEGNYRVTLTLGDPKAAAVTTVKAETRRLMLEAIHTDAGKFETRTFTVNIRTPKISTGGEVNVDSREMNLTTHVAVTNTWDDKLTISFSDAHPALAAMEVKKVDDAITVFVLGDSTVTDQPSGGSWGQALPRWFKADVAIANHAESGETLRGFLKERRWDKVLDTMKPGDYVLIQFGTNDSKSSGPQNIYPNQDFSETYAPAETVYKDLLKQFVADARKKGGLPVIISPPARRGETSKSTLGAYATAAGEAAKEVNCPFIDLNAMGMQLNQAMGADAAKIYADQTHTAEYGCYLFSRCVTLGIKQLNLPLAKYIVDDFGNFDPKQPHPLPTEINFPADAGRGGAGGGRAAGGAGSAGRGGRRGAAGTGAPATTDAPAPTP
jgi:lysophospholipase L1-like esterase